ncbi:polyprenyl synthetase family protein [Pseudomonas sp. COR18]|uniref:polyprenyl synthetase family protein n=1 Tax=Pseudomonas sp. COR18 TaxID=3399680 RepID=UPI003B002604
MNTDTHCAVAGGLPNEKACRPLDDWRRAVLARLEQRLDAQLPPAHTVPSRLHEAMRHALLNPGKRLRPLLCQASGLVVGADPQALDVVSAALEMVHVSSLVHDDLPAMDDDPLRHGQPTVHVRFDEATAILTGTALLTQAFLTLQHAPLPSARRLRLVAELAQATGSLGMCGGQMLDLQPPAMPMDLDTLERLQQRKTGALIRAAVRMGALCGRPLRAEVEALERYATAIGLGLQVVDDVLDVTQDSATLGKTAGKDVRDARSTYVSLIGLAASQALARQLKQQAHAALARFDSRADCLRALADQAIDRQR